MPCPFEFGVISPVLTTPLVFKQVISCQLLPWLLRSGPVRRSECFT